jgi:hypothetical protein
VQVRHPAIIGPALHHVADVDDELIGLGLHVEPGAILELDLQAARTLADRKNREAAKVRMLARADLVGGGGSPMGSG